MATSAAQARLEALRVQPSRTNVNVSKISSVVLQQQKTGDLKDANFPTDAEGRTYHVGCKRGEISNRIITVGDPRRAERLAALLDDADRVWRRASNRGFVVYTGRKHGVPLSIVATGMGFPMVDFLVREARHIVDGPLLMIRFGTCGCLENVPVGTVVVHSKGAVSVLRNPDAFRPQAEPHLKPYVISRPVPASEEVSRHVLQHMRRLVGEQHVREGMDATADSFYSSQGRQDRAFADRNSTLLSDVKAAQPDVLTLEMETFHLFDLAQVSVEPMLAASACLVLANRVTNDFLDNASLARLETAGGRAVIEAAVEVPLQNTMDADEHAVWNQDPSQWAGQVSAAAQH